MDEFVEVMDVTVVTDTPGVTLHYTIREHEGDSMRPDGGALRFKFGPREVKVGTEKRTLQGRSVSVPGGHIVEVTSTPRLELKVRPSAKALANREQAEIDALRKTLGVDKE